MLKNLIVLVDVDDSFFNQVKNEFKNSLVEKAFCLNDILKFISAKNYSRYAIVLKDKNKDITKAFPNNTVFLDVESIKTIKSIKWILSNYGMEKPLTDNVFFISDCHFYHANIIKYCNRPWNSGKDENGNLIVTDDDVNRMNEDMIQRWNSVVGKDDIVWNLGDFAFGGKENVEKIFKRLNGKINLVLGNHDHQKIKFYYDVGFHAVYDRPVVIDNFIVLSHAPLEWIQAPIFNCFGHVHDNSIYKTWDKNGCCLCVERHNYTPVSWKEIRENIEKLG